MTDVLLRRTASGWMVAVPFARERGGKPDIGTRHRKHYASPSDAVKAAMARLTEKAPESSQSECARPPSVESLKPSARRVLNYMRSHTGVSKHDTQNWTPAVMNLPGRIHEIREVFGYDAVETVRRGESGYARYVWRGPTEIQLEMEAA